MKAHQAMKPASADAQAFDVALKLARASRAAGLCEAPLDLGENDEFFKHIERVRDTLEHAHKAAGATGNYRISDCVHLTARAAEDELFSLMQHWSDAGYLYGLALGLALKGRA